MPQAFRQWIQRVKVNWIPSQVDACLNGHDLDEDTLSGAKQRVVGFAENLIPSHSFAEREHNETDWSDAARFELYAFLIRMPSATVLKGLIAVACHFELERANKDVLREKRGAERRNRPRLTQAENDALRVTAQVFAEIMEGLTVEDFSVALRNGIELARDLTPSKINTIEQVLKNQINLNGRPTIEHINEVLEEAITLSEETKEKLKSVDEKASKVEKLHEQVSKDYDSAKKGYEKSIENRVKNIERDVGKIKEQLTARQKARFDIQAR